MKLNSNILQKLDGGDLRSIGKSNEVAQLVLDNPALFKELFEGMLNTNPLIRMRAADAIEKITAQRPNFLQPYKMRLINEVSRIEQQEVRWHIAQILPRLELDKEEQKKVVSILKSYLNDKSKIVKTFSMQALADLALINKDLLSIVLPIIKNLTETGSPAMVSRGRKLLQKLSAL